MIFGLFGQYSYLKNFIRYIFRKEGVEGRRLVAFRLLLTLTKGNRTLNFQSNEHPPKFIPPSFHENPRGTMSTLEALVCDLLTILKKMAISKF